ncbi:hypothetical protein D3C71_1194550 [compost metagenome]|jgi:DNA-binding SARP family transcriptional activator
MVLIFSVPSAVSTSHVRINREALKTVRDELGSLFVWTPICAAATELICALPRYPSMYDKHHNSAEQLKLRKAKKRLARLETIEHLLEFDLDSHQSYADAVAKERQLLNQMTSSSNG